MQLEFIGKTAIVTGAASGIGLAIADTLTEAGLTVVIADRDANAVADKVEAIRRAGRTAIPYAIDLSDAQAVAQMMSEIRSLTGGVHFMVTDAGEDVSKTLPPELMTADRDEVISVNLDGKMHGIRLGSAVKTRKGSSAGFAELVNFLRADSAMRNPFDDNGTVYSSRLH